MLSSYLQETHFILPNTRRLIVKGCKKIFHINGNNGNHKRAGMAIMIADKVDFKSKQSQEIKKDVTIQ